MTREETKSEYIYIATMDVLSSIYRKKGHK